MSKQQRFREVDDALARARAADDGLPAIEAARDLRRAAEELERAYIKTARGNGLSWAKIGAAYGLSKQGAQQRFAKRAGGEGATTGADAAARAPDAPDASTPPSTTPDR